MSILLTQDFGSGNVCLKLQQLGLKQNLVSNETRAFIH